MPSLSGKKLLQAVAVLRWGRNLLLLNKKLSDDETLFYAQECAKKNWNRDLLRFSARVAATGTG